MAAVFAACYCYQVVFRGGAAAEKAARRFTAQKLCRYAVLIAARNEERRHRPAAGEHPGAKLPPGFGSTFTWWRTTAPTTPRKSPRPAGPGFSSARISCRWARASRCGFCCKKSRRSTPRSTTTGYFVFDADNLLDPRYITEMNKVFLLGQPGGHQLPQHQKLRRQLDHRRVWPVVFAGRAST